jgi:hypothetical protein
MKTHRAFRALILALLCLSSGLASAAVIVTAVETGGDVVLTVADGGSLDLSALTPDGLGTTAVAGINPSFPNLVLSSGSGPVNGYIGSIVAPSDYGAGGLTFASSGSGDLFGYSGGGDGRILVPDGYVSGNPLVGTSIFSGATFASLGMAAGTYVWSWSSDSLTLNVEATVPIPSAAWLLGSALGFLLWMRRQAI